MIIEIGKAFWIEYILAVPESIYNPSLFEIEAIDKAGDFLKLCKINEEQVRATKALFCLQFSSHACL